MILGSKETTKGETAKGDTEDGEGRDGEGRDGEGRDGEGETAKGETAKGRRRRGDGEGETAKGRRRREKRRRRYKGRSIEKNKTKIIIITLIFSNKIKKYLQIKSDGIAFKFTAYFVSSSSYRFVSFLL
jgi:hypothetical protein